MKEKLAFFRGKLFPLSFLLAGLAFFLAWLPASIHAQAAAGAGNCLSFNGTNFVTIAPTGSITGTFTVEAWVNPASTNGSTEIFSTRSPGEYSFDMQVTGGIGLHGDIGDGFAWITTAADGNFPLITNQWFHAAYVVTPTNYAVYANGQQVGGGSYAPDTPVLYDGTHPITVAAWTANQSLFKGQIDEIRIWNVARTQGQIQSNMTARLAGNEAGLVDYYRLDEPNTGGAGILVLDSTSRHNNGAMTNRPFRVRSTAPLTDRIILNGGNLISGECHTALNDPGAGLAPRAIAGHFFTGAALRADGRVVGSGLDGDGQVSGATNAAGITAIALGGYHGLGLRADGSVMGWGQNVFGQLNFPPGATNIVAVAGGQYHSELLRADGKIFICGTSDALVLLAAVTNAVAIAAGYDFGLALKADGTVFATGDNTYGETNVPPTATNVVAIAAGTYFSMALRADGSVVAWGNNANGQTTVPPSATNVVAIAAGSGHALALRADGSVLGWGDNVVGAINIPAAATNVLALAAGESWSVALRWDGKIIGWGDNSFGESLLSTNANTSAGISVGGNVNTNVPGNYFLLYTVTNAFGSNAVFRSVEVDDTTPPFISLNGANPYLLKVGGTYVEPGATATDLCAGDMTSSLVVTGSVNAAVIGNYTVSYQVTDAYGNTGISNRLVEVGDVPSIGYVEAYHSGGDNPITGNPSMAFQADINPNNQPTTLSFTYGLPFSPTATTAGTSLPASTIPIVSIYAVTNLSFGVPYHFHAVAQNSFGTAVSPDQTILLQSIYVTPGDLDGDGIVSQGEFEQVYNYYLLTSPYLLMTNVAGLGGTNVTFALSNPPSSPYTVEYSTNLTDWTAVGSALPLYQFTDTNAPGSPQRFYRLRWP